MKSTADKCARTGALSIQRSAVLFALAVSATSCASKNDQDVAKLSDTLYVSTGTTMWNDNQLGVGTTIPVCFTVRPRIDASGVTQCASQTDRTRACDGSVMPTDSLRALIIEHVENTWFRYGNIEAVGWGDCPIDPATNKHKDTSMPNTVAIQFGDSDVTMILGKSASFATVIQYNWQALNNGVDRFNLVHEFGHALGFEHEWRRNDWTLDRCGASALGGTNLSPFPDVDSKMQYCVGSQPDVPTLSPGDIIGVQVAYGRKHTGAIVGHRGKCANIQTGQTTNGLPIITWPCRNQWYDTWTRDPVSTFELFKTPSNSKCLNVSGGTAPNPVISWPCADVENERFTTVGVEWRGMGNMCMQEVNGKVEARVCNGSLAQKWDFFHTSGSLRRDQIRRNGTSRCVSSSTTTGAFGEELITATCSSTDTKQRFTMPGNGVLALSNNTSLCANVLGGLPTPGSKVGLWNGCAPSGPFYNAQFTLSGRIKSLGNCMDIQGNGGNGDPVRAQACSSSNVTTQIWDYYL